MTDMRVVWFCAEECWRQRSGELSVARMIVAYNMAVDISGANYPTKQDILFLGEYVDPDANRNGFRKVPAIVNGSVIGWENIDHQIEALCEATAMLSPNEWFQQYEEIHPFKDGNGRTGQILFNWIMGTLDNPQFCYYGMEEKCDV